MVKLLPLLAVGAFRASLGVAGGSNRDTGPQIDRSLIGQWQVEGGPSLDAVDALRRCGLYLPAAHVSGLGRCEERRRAPTWQTASWAFPACISLLMKLSLRAPLPWFGLDLPARRDRT